MSVSEVRQILRRADELRDHATRSQKIADLLNPAVGLPLSIGSVHIDHGYPVDKLLLEEFRGAALSLVDKLLAEAEALEAKAIVNE